MAKQKNEDSSDGVERESSGSPDQDKGKERRLVADCLLGEPFALKTLVQRYASVFRAAAFRALADGPKPVSCDWHDLVQQLVLALNKNPLSFLVKFDADQGRLGRYLGRVAYNQYLKMLRSHSVNWPGKRMKIGSPRLAAVPAHEDEAADLSEFITKLLSKLSDTSHEITQARYGLGPFKQPLSVEEIAKRLKISPRQVYRKLQTVLCNRMRRLTEKADSENTF